MEFMSAASPSLHLVLASASPRRRDLLSRLGVPFEIVAPREVDERVLPGSARETARALAVRKAESVCDRLLETREPDSTAGLVILGSDTVIAAGRPPQRERVLGKPVDSRDAHRMLRELSGCVHCVWTGVALASPAGSTRVESERTEVTFRDLSEEEIADYVAGGEPLDKAGSYGVQGAGRALVDSFTGCYYNIVGLPIVRVARMLGLEPPECGCASHPLQRGGPGCTGPQPHLHS